MRTKKMATVPTLDESERAVLDYFLEEGTRAGQSVKSVALTPLFTGSSRFKHADISAALDSMITKKWIEVKIPGFYTLTDLGFAEV